MGNSNSRSNDLMIDILVRRNRALVRNVEKAFRLVDRAHFLPSNQRNNAYTLLPLRLQTNEDGPLWPGPLHISSTDIYIAVARELDFQKGNSFLNIGSGSGYFSTVAGFLIGDTGINHGIDVYQNLVDYADERVKQFILEPASSSTGWVRPEFRTCDAHNEAFLEKHAETYDRIYVGFIIRKERILSRILRMLKVGGVLVAPNERNLCRYIRMDADHCHRTVLSRMSFARAIKWSPNVPLPPAPTFDTMPSLIQLARQAVRRSVRLTSFTPNVMKRISRTILVGKNGQNRRPDIMLPHSPRHQALEQFLEHYAAESDDSHHHHHHIENLIRVEQVDEGIPTESSSTSDDDSQNLSLSDDSISSFEGINWRELGTIRTEYERILTERGVRVPERGSVSYEEMERVVQDARRNPPEEEDEEPDPLHMKLFTEQGTNGERRTVGVLAYYEISSDEEQEPSDYEDSDEQESEKEEKKPSGEVSFEIGQAEGAETDDEPEGSESDGEREDSSDGEDGPSTSAGPSRNNTQKRHLDANRKPTKRFKETVDGNKKKKKSGAGVTLVQLRASRDKAVKVADSNFRERIRQFPIPKKVQDYVSLMQHDVKI
ncbi:unnamed protein product [Caenorhabditis sp. 36 PRJEB53466]|nr:unnamed protein product [Caenorhabditis sp. 36 PRJEB53466]